MDNKPELLPPNTTYPDPQAALTKEQAAREKRILIGIIIGAVFLLLVMIGSLVYLLNAPLTSVSRIRDIFIIFMGVQSLLLGLVMMILLVQLARLTNLLQNEIKPILESTNETVSNLRGTTSFLSDNLVEPVIKLNEHLASLQQLLVVLGLFRKRSK